MGCLIISMLNIAGCDEKKVGYQNSQLYDTGVISVLVPEGWQGYHGADVFNEFKENGDPNKIHVGKGVKDELELYFYPRIDIYFRDSLFSDFELNMMKNVYEKVEEIEPIQLANFIWTGFTASSMDYPYVFLFADDGSNALQVAILLENNNKKITINDEDVQLILNSIVINNQEAK